jgi:predicted alpha/beta-fold hydrolase
VSWSFPDFVERTPWLGPDLQTLRNVLLPRSLQLSGVLTQRLTLPLDDGSGDALSVSYHRPATDTSRPLVVLIHGLSGTEDSTYMIASARLLLRRGHPVARLNLRGAGPSRPLCRLQYHAGRTKDLRAALRSFAAHDGRVMRGGLLLVGYSLGANMLLKFLAEYAGEFPVHGAASISAPIDLAAASRRFLDTRNRIYHWRLLRYMKIEALGRPDAVTDDERRCILAAGSIYEYDDRFVAPRNGYASAEEYYHANMARRFLADIRHPTLIIHAQDDPWIPADAYTSYPWNENPYLIPLLPRGGGHVGFHGRGSPSPWYDRCLEIFFDRLATRTENADNSREAFTPRRERAAQ